MISCLVVICGFVALAAEKKTGVIYLSERYRTTTALLSAGLSIEQLGAELSLQTLNIGIYQALSQFAKEKEINPQREQIRIRAYQNKVFIEGLNSPIVIANSPELKMSYLGHSIPFSPKLAPIENLKKIDKFFQTYSKASATKESEGSRRLNGRRPYWQSLLFGESEALALGPLVVLPAIATVMLATGCDQGLEAYREERRDDIFEETNRKKLASIKCDGNDFLIGKGDEIFRFSLTPNMPVPPQNKVSRDMISIVSERKPLGNAYFDPIAEEIISPKGRFKDTEFMKRAGPQLKKFAKKMLKENNEFICPYKSPSAEEDWAKVAVIVKNRSVHIADELIPELNKAPAQ